MKFKLKTPVTIYEVYLDSDNSELLYRIKPIKLSTLDDILDLGRTAYYSETCGYANLFETEVEAVMDAYKRTTTAHTSDESDTCNCGDCDCTCDCHKECTIPEPTIEQLYPMDEYPSKLVRFDTTDTIRLFRRRPGQKPASNCAFITQKEANKFKKDANVKSNYSLTRVGKPGLYMDYINKYFD